MILTAREIDTHWDTYYPKVYGYFFRRLHNPADVEELTSVVLTEFFDKVLDNPNPGVRSPHAYLWQVAYHTLVNFVRHKSKRPPVLELDENFAAPDTLEDTLQAEVVQAKFERVLGYAEAELSPRDFDLFSRVYLRGERVKDVAATAGLKPNTLTVRLRRIIKQLQIQAATYD